MEPKHVETPIKVNAWVDCGIAPLVEALSTFDNVITVDSCEGTGRDPAYVYFVYRGNTTEFAGFVEQLSLSLGHRIPADNEYSVKIEWVAGRENPMATLLVRRDFVKRLAAVIHDAAKNESKNEA